jgi:uncharacterized protein
MGSALKNGVVVGRVDSLWRYPVKSMRGEQLAETFLGFGGVCGDRLFAFHYSRARQDFPYLTAREQPTMLRYQPRWQQSASLGESAVVVETPTRDRFAIDDPRLISLLGRSIPEGETLSLLRSDRAMTDCHPVSLFSIQTARQLSQALKMDLDIRRFRANIYADLTSNIGFAEDEFVGRKLLLGSAAVVQVIERDERCKIITLDPETAQADPNIMRQVARAHEKRAGIYGSVLIEGTVKRGDEIALMP